MVDDVIYIRSYESIGKDGRLQSGYGAFSHDDTPLVGNDLAMLCLVIGDNRAIDGKTGFNQRSADFPFASSESGSIWLYQELTDAQWSEFAGYLSGAIQRRREGESNGH